jgi:hypothetical protein
VQQSSVDFMAANRFHYETLINAGYVKHVDSAFKERLLQIIREEFQPGYNANLWCGACVADMIKFAWEQYDRQAVPERVTVVSEIGLLGPVEK